MQTEAMSLRAEALFVSDLQRSDDPTPAQVRAAVSASLRRRGARECAAELAQQFGDHPVESVWRMTWALAMVQKAYPDSGPPPTSDLDGPEPATDLAGTSAVPSPRG